MKVRIVNKSAFEVPNMPPHIPQNGFAGNISEPVTLGSLCRAMIPTGLFIELPEGYEAQIRPARPGRETWYFGHNSPGTIDADYRGEINVLLVNLSPDPFTINPENVLHRW